MTVAIGFEVTPKSHVDHQLPPGVFDWVREQVKELGLTGFFIRTFDIPEAFAPAVCALRGPLVGDAEVLESEVEYLVRPGRTCATRGTRKLGYTQSRKVTVICGPSGDLPCALYTVFGGPAAPREPGDLTLPTLEQIVESRAFWAVHALALSENPS